MLQLRLSNESQESRLSQTGTAGDALIKNYVSCGKSAGYPHRGGSQAREWHRCGRATDPHVHGFSKGKRPRGGKSFSIASSGNLD
jgi:hypothetical protein